MDSSADHTGSESAAPSQDAAAHVPASEPVAAAETHHEASAASEPVKSEATPEILAPIKADAAPEASRPAAQAASAASTSRPGSALVKFIPAAERFDAGQSAAAQAASPSRAKSLLMLYGSRAALVVLLLGSGYLASAHFFQGDSSAKADRVAQAPAPSSVALPVVAPLPAAPQAVAPLPAVDSAERTEMRRVTQQLSDEIRSLKASLDSLRSSVAQSQSDEVRGLKKGLDGMKSGLEASKTETNAAIAQLAARIEHLQRDQATKLQQVLERAERAEQRSTSSAALTTATIPTAAPIATTPTPVKAQTQAALQNQVPVPSPAVELQKKTPQTQAALQNIPVPSPAVEPQKKTPPSLTNWVVRDVYDGIATVEGPGGAFEVMQGESIPGIGMVKSIERHGNGWTVVTNRGVVEMAHD
jgi:hypothetical protein